jgi:hypothetical protein
LRKYEDVLKVQELVTKAEHSYNRIEGYSENGDANAEYWATQLPAYQKTIDLHKVQIQEVIENLAQKGIDVTQIEFQTKTTEDKIAELDKELEELPAVRENLVVQYRIEKEEQLKVNENRDYVRERANENSVLYNSLLKVNLIGNVTNSLNIVFNQKENRDNTITVIRKR